MTFLSRSYFFCFLSINIAFCNMNILMVCLGNICRSPLAHGILQHMVALHKLDWIVDSAGTGDWHVGHSPDHRSISIAKKYGIDISEQRAQHFTVDLFDSYDLIFVMDKHNYNDVVRLAKSNADKEKVRLFLKNEIVPDPYYDDAMFEPVYKMVEKRCNELILELS